MSAENDQIIPVKVKYIEAQSAIILRNEKIRPSTPPFKIQEPRRQNGEATLLQNGVCRSPVDAENIEITHSSPVMTPCTSSPTNPLVPNRFQFDPSLTYAEKVAHEMIVTEKIYLDNLKQIIDGFLGPVANDPDLDVSKENIDDLFINVEEIYHFNWVLLQNMEKCNFDPVKLAECFVVKQVGFEIYTKYCTHYPRSMEVLLEWNQREDTANFIKKQQESLGHTLPLCSFLLKPVQRILKYHLLLGNIAKHFKQSEDEEGYKIIQKALSAMTNVAKHINDMKRKHEDAVHLQEIQSVLLDYEGPNLTSYGSIVLEDTFRLHGTKTGRYLLLFEKALLITKRRSDGTFSWKATVMYSNMMLADSVFREPLTFQVIPFDDRKICYTFVSRDLDTKQVWLLELKRRLLDSYAAAVPMKAKQIILGNSREDNEKENDEPENTRRLSTRKGANLQRHLSKENSAQFSKPSKNADPERRKYKDTDEATEEKTKTSMDSIKSPLRRKLRVFKKRRFTKESGKSSKRVSWSSDDNNDESYPCKEKRVSSNKQNKIQERKVSDNEPCEAIPEKENIAEPDMHRENNENEVSISSLLRDGKTMVSVTGEVDNHLSGHVKLRNGPDDALPSKKRRLAKGKRQKCKSMPAGEFPAMNEDGALLSIDKTESTLTRTQSLSRLYEKFLENELIDTPTSIKELQKYGLVNVRENSAKTKRLGSYDEQLASEEGLIHRSSDMGDVISAQTDDVMSNTDQSVHQTMKRVSMAFSDISPNFSPQKSPASSLDDLTNEDMTEDLTAGDLTTEDLTAGDLTPDEYTAGDLTPEDDTAGDLTPEEFTAGDLSHDESGTGSSLPNIMVSGEGPNLVGYGDESVCNVHKDRNEDSGLECKVCMENGVTTEWNQNATTDNTYSQDSLYEEQSNPERRSTVHSEASSYVDTLSDDSCDEHVERLWLNNSRRSYERVFSLRRSYSEENLVSKYPLEEKQAENDPSVVASKSCTQFNHAPVMRSKSADCSKLAPQRESRPFTFSVTPKKKIVIKDSLWETIKEDAETNHHEILVGKDVHVLRRRKKRKSGHKKSKKNRSQSSEGRVENTQHVVRTCAVLNMGDYRATTNDANEINSARNSMEEKDLKTKTRDRGEKNAMSGSQKNIEKKSYSTLPNLSEKTDSNIVRSDSQNNTGSNCGNITLASLTETEKNSNAMTSHKVEETANHQHPPVTKIAVALRKKGHRSARKKSLVRVDGNVSEVPSTINYLCIETFPSDRAASAEREPETSTRDVKQTNGNAASRVERLSKYFNEVTTENYKHSGKYDVYKPAERLRKGSSIKKRVEELSRREDNSQKSRKNSEGKLTIEAELYSLQNAPDRIGFRRRSTSDEAHAKTRIELTSSLNNDKPNVQQLKNRLEEQDSGEIENSKSLDDNNGLAKKTSTSLRIRDRIQELGQNPDKNPERNADDDLRSCRRLKERIERLQKGAKRAEVDSKRDITISDDTSETSSEPQQNEELRTVVIKRGWVQQFIQRIETGS